MYTALKYLFQLFFFVLFGITAAMGQYADLGTGALKDKIWWFDWNGFAISNGASRIFTTTDGLTVKVEFSNVQNTVPVPWVMNTWSGVVLNMLYNFSNSSIKPALFSDNTTQNSDFTITVSATRDGNPSPFTLIAADAEASDSRERIDLETSASPWQSIEFFRNSGQSQNPLIGCGTQNTSITLTYGGNVQLGQNPILATESEAGGELTVKVHFDRTGPAGGIAIAFGILAPVDRGDLPSNYGFAYHNLSFKYVNSCNYISPFPSLLADETLMIGRVPGDADGIQTQDDNSDGADEDGITVFPVPDASGSYSVKIPVTNRKTVPGHLFGWIDHNRDGMFDISERAYSAVAPNETEVILTWTNLPASFPEYGEYAIRFRLSSDQSSAENPTGTAPDGEVEDYLVELITPPPPIANFTIPSEVCANTPVTLTNTSINGSTFRWTFCDANQVPNPVLVESFGASTVNFRTPTFMDVVKTANVYYAFAVSHESGSIFRMDFGTSLANTPAFHDLGNFGTLPPTGTSGGIKAVSVNGEWYLIIVCGNENAGIPSKIVTIELGADIKNLSPSITDWGNIGGLNDPADFHLFEENGKWYGLVLNPGNNSITRLDFGADFTNPPTGMNLGNLGGLDIPTGLEVVNDYGEWRMFITNKGQAATQSSLTRLDFGNSFLNTPIGTNLGNPNNILDFARDIVILQACGKTEAYVINENLFKPQKLIFENGLNAVPVGVVIPGGGVLSKPYSFSKSFVEGDEYITFITGYGLHSIYRMRNQTCGAEALPSTSDETPAPIILNTPGAYRVTLIVNEGEPNEQRLCRQILVKPQPTAGFEFSRDICSPTVFSFTNSSKDYGKLEWDFGNGQIASDIESASIDFDENGTYQIRLKASHSSSCFSEYTQLISIDLIRDSAIINRDTSICATNLSFQLNALPALSYCWFPATGLSASNISNPQIVLPNIPGTTTYYLHAEVFSETNLVVNGDFSLGNTGFQSDYINNQLSGYAEGIYAVRTDVGDWHNNLANCSDHTTGDGHMLLVNGAATVSAKVWTQQITVKPNTDYAFAAWIMSLHNANPAQLKFSINDQPLGTPINASTTTCNWQQFYTVWNSGNTTSAEISIVNMNQALGGNDFALDDIAFSELRTVRDSITITIEPLPEVDFSHSVIACKAVSFEANVLNTGIPVAHWSWNFGDGNEEEADLVSYRYKDGGTYNVQLTALGANGCAADILHTVQLDTVKAIIYNSDTSVCRNATITLKGDGGTSALWTPTYFVVDPNEFSTGAEVEESRRYFLTVRDNIGCEHTDSIMVSVIPPPAFIKPPDIQVCADSVFQLLGANNAQFSYSWSPQVTLDDPSSMNPVAIPGAANLYQVTIAEPFCGYNKTFDVKVKVNPNPTISVSKSSDIDCRMPSTFINAEMSAGSKVTWSPSIGLDNPTSIRPLVSASKTTTYVAKVTNEYGCSAFDSVLVNVSNVGLKLFDAPNAFTPNGDGYNDCFSIKRWGSTEILEFSIYNRWGEKVFTGRTVSDCWDGTFRGQPQPSGNYIYVVRANTICGEVFRKGQVVLVR